MASPGPRINLASATITPFEDAKARETVTRTDDNGVVQFVPTTILQADGSQLSHIPIDSLLALLLDTCRNAIPSEGTNEDVGLVTALLAANEGGRDAADKDLRKRRAIISQAFEFLVTSTTIFGIPRSSMRRAKLGEATYLLLPSRLQMATPYIAATSNIPPPMKTPPPNTSILGKHGRGSETSSEAGNKGEDGGAASSQARGGETFGQAGGLRTDFDIPKQVVFSICLRTTDNKLYNTQRMADQNLRVQLHPSRTSSTALPHLYSSAIRNSTVQTARCDRSLRPYKRLCLFACNNTNNNQ